jgi:DNA-binding transcriptional MerR regulator
VPIVPSTTDELVPPHVAASLLHVARWTLIRYARAGLLHPLRLPSGHRRYRLAELQRLRDSGSEQ